MSLTFSSAIDWLEECHNLHYLHQEQPLERIRKLLELCGNPQQSLSIIHITGSKGKSSCAAALAALLRTSKLRCGLFTSPHIMRYNERIKIDGADIDDSSMLAAIENLRAVIIEEQTRNARFVPTTFERLLAIALCEFHMRNLDWVIIEAGIGGQHDSSNVLIPKLSILTSIEQEHGRILGSSVEEIAQDKAGIIKANTPVLLGHQHHESVMPILQNKAKKEHAPCYRSDTIVHYTHRPHAQGGSSVEMRISLHSTDSSFTTTPPADSSTFSGDAHASKETHAKTDTLSVYETTAQFITPATLPVLIDTQVLAYLAAQILVAHNLPPIPSIPPALQLEQDALLSCRAELLTPLSSKYPPLYLDMAHTPHSLHATLAHALERCSTAVLLIGLAEDKNEIQIAEALHNILPRFTAIICSSSEIRSPKTPQKIYDAFAQVLSTTPSAKHSAFGTAQTAAQSSSAQSAHAQSSSAQSAHAQSAPMQTAAQSSSAQRLRCMPHWKTALRKAIDHAHAHAAMLLVCGSAYLCAHCKSAYLQWQKKEAARTGTPNIERG